MKKTNSSILNSSRYNIVLIALVFCSYYIDNPFYVHTSYKFMFDSFLVFVALISVLYISIVIFIVIKQKSIIINEDLLNQIQIRQNFISRYGNFYNISLPMLLLIIIIYFIEMSQIIYDQFRVVSNQFFYERLFNFFILFIFGVYIISELWLTLTAARKKKELDP